MLRYLALAAAPLLATPFLVHAQTSQYAQTASEIANAIKAGENLRERTDMPTLGELEYAEVAKLAGCNSALLQGGRADIVVINWSCGDPAEGTGVRRSTAMIFDSDGVLYGFAVNPVIAEFEPTAVARGAGNLPSRYQLAKAFGEAVSTGGDASLGGFLALGEYERARLAELANSRFRVVRRSVNEAKTVSFTRWQGDSRERTRVHIFFDGDDRPTGMIFAPTYDPDWVAPDGYTSADRGASKSSGPANVRVVRPSCAIC